MLQPLSELMGALPSTCDYADARFVDVREQSLIVRNGELEQVLDEGSQGVGVRVLCGGAFGFAATRDLSDAGLREALARAIAIAESRPLPAGPGIYDALAPLEAPANGRWASAAELDPLAVALEDKLALLAAAEEALRGDRRMAESSAWSYAGISERVFASSEGAACTQTLTECGGGIRAVAVDGEELQVRSYPSGHGGSVAAAGWEHVLALDLPAHAPRVAAEALELLTAPPCPSGRATLVLGDEQLALQLHESIGHALELDRVLLGEASYAGTSWVTPEQIGTLRYGSEQLNVTADATLPGGLGTYGWDDEGVAAQRIALIRDGVLRAPLSDRPSAAAAGLERSGGCARADGFARTPIVRMTNVSIEPGTAGTLERLLADTGEGVYMETNRSWSIDDRRLHFQFATEIAREIRGGELGRLYRNPSYAGVTPRFWGGLDAVCSEPAWRVWGLLNCGKGEPGQIAHVSHGAAPARFRDVEIGVA